MPPKIKRSISIPKTSSRSRPRTLSTERAGYKLPLPTPATIERGAKTQACADWGFGKFKDVLGTTSRQEMLRVQKALNKLPIATWNKGNRAIECQYLWSHILTAQQKARLINEERKRYFL
jgi:hypothetical protein